MTSLLRLLTSPYVSVVFTPSLGYNSVQRYSYFRYVQLPLNSYVFSSLYCLHFKHLLNVSILRSCQRHWPESTHLYVRIKGHFPSLQFIYSSLRRYSRKCHHFTQVRVNWWRTKSRDGVPSDGSKSRNRTGDSRKIRSRWWTRKTPN